MFWTEELIQSLDKKKKQLVGDSWSTSGFGHIGSLRGAVIHEVAFKALKNAGFDVSYTFFMDDFDPMDGMPKFLDEEVYGKHLGEPLSMIPAPEGKQSLAEYFAKDFDEALKNAGVEAKILWESGLYKKGKFNDVIKVALDNADRIREVYRKISGAKKPNDWYPFHPICEKCGKIGSTKVYDWDGEKVSYKCDPNAAQWAKGCGYNGKISPFNGNGKLPWRVSWPARWKALEITVEGEGKDHWSAGGSRGMADVLAREIFDCEPPYDIRYDFFLIGGKKMSSSAGRGVTARKMSEILPHEVLSFLLAQAPRKTIEFDPKGDTVPRIYDSYDRAREAYFGRIDFPDLGKAFLVCQTQKPKDGYRMRFMKAAYAIQMPRVNISDLAAEEKGNKLTVSEKNDLQERIVYAKKWLDEFAPEDYVFEVQESLPTVQLNSEQKNFLKILGEKLEHSDWTGQTIHTTIHDLRKQTQIQPKEAFQAIYLIFLGKDSGPQAGWLLSSLEKDFALKRIKEAL